MASPSPKIQLSVEPSTLGALKGKALVEQVIDPELRAFQDWFKNQKHGNSGLTKMELELFRAYLYQKITGVL